MSITHQWNDTVLTVTSDSGTSSADLKGPKGDTGPRGPQGAPGVIYGEDGNLVLDLSPYATLEMVDAALDNLDFDGYATENFVITSIAQAQLAEVAGDVDLSGFATKDDLADVEVNIDNKTLLKNADGTIRTAIGGYASGGAMRIHETGIYYIPEHNKGTTPTPTGTPIITSPVPFMEGEYHIRAVFADGTIEDRMIELKANKSSGGYIYYYYWGNFATGEQPQYISHIQCSPTKHTVDIVTDGVVCTITEFLMERDGVTPIEPVYVPIDNATLVINDDNKIAVAFEMEGGQLNLSNYYTKAEIDALLAAGGSGSGSGVASSEEVEY